MGALLDGVSGLVGDERQVGRAFVGTKINVGADGEGAGVILRGGFVSGAASVHADRGKVYAEDGFETCA